MVTIRLNRRGGKKEPFYHVVVTDSRRRGSGPRAAGFLQPGRAWQQRRAASRPGARRLLAVRRRAAFGSRRAADQGLPQDASRRRSRPNRRSARAQHDCAHRRYCDRSAVVVLGRVGAPFGVQGWVKVSSYTDPARGHRRLPGMDAGAGRRRPARSKCWIRSWRDAAWPCSSPASRRSRRHVR